MEPNKRCCFSRNGNADELMILRALYFAQKRAEEAERKLLLANEEKRKAAKLMIEVSTRVSMYKNWERLLEMESELLERRLKKRRSSSNEERVDVAMVCWDMGLVWLGFVGAGFVLGRICSELLY